MESKKINQLATNLAPVSTDLTVVGNPTTGELKKITLLQISSLFGGGISSIGLVVPSGFSVSPATLTANGTFTITGAGTVAQYIRGDGSLATFPTFLSSDRLIQEVRNNSGATMLKGTIVYINGAVGNKATIAKALATSDATSAQTYGVVQDDISNNSNGYVVVIGEVTGLDTSAVTEGQQLYLSGSIAGYYTVTKPYAPIHLVYVAVVLRSHPTLGVLGVKIQNGYEMDELHNVDAVSPSNNDGLFYNTTTSLWEHKSISTVLGYTPASSSLFVPYSGATTNVDLGTYNLTGKVLFIKEQTAGSFSNTSGTTAINVSDSYFSFSRNSTQRASFYYQPNAYSYTLPASSGTLALTSDIPSLTGYVPTTRTISTTSPLSGGGDLSANRTFAIAQSTTSVDGYLSATDWTTFNGKQGTITLTTTGTSGAATLISNTLNIPQYAASMAIGGSITSATAGSVLFAGTSGVLAQNNALFFWDDTNARLAIGRNSATGKLDIQGVATTDGGQLGSELTTTGSGTNWAGTGFATGYTHTTGDTTALTTSLAAISGTIYQFVYTITGRTTGSITIAYGGISIANIISTGNFGRVATATTSLSITPTTDFNGTIVLSIKVVTAGSSLINTRNSAGIISNEIRSYPTNFYIGVDSGKYNTLATSNIGIGYQTLVDNVVGQNNIAIGYQALNRNIASDNIAFGYRAGNSITTGTSNILFGTNSAVSMTTGFSNIAFGFQSGLALSTGSENIVIGISAGQSLNTGTRNYLAGRSAGGNITSGINNIAIGTEALLQTGTASNNIGIGERAGAYTSAYSSVVPSNCIYIGASCFSGSTAPSNEIVIGSTTSTIGLGSNTTMIGNSNTITTALRGRLILGTTTDSGSYQLDVNGTARVSGTSTLTGSVTLGAGAELGVPYQLYVALIRPFSSANSILFFPGNTPTNAVDLYPTIGPSDNNNSGTRQSVNISQTFSPASGNAVRNQLNIAPTINQTGTANGISRGLLIAPTLTAAADWRAIEISGGGVYVNTTSVAASAILQADSTTKGFLPPRMTTTQKNAIATPAAGLVVFDTTLGKLCVYSGTAWETITSL